MNNCNHRPGPVTSVDKYIDTARCLGCGRALYYLTSAYDDLMLPGKNRVMERLDELQRASDLLFEQSAPKVQEQIKAMSVKQEAIITKTTALLTEKTPILTKQPVILTEMGENMTNNMPVEHPLELPPVPTPPKGNRVAMHNYWITNSPAILTELQTHSTRQTQTRWGMSGSILHKIQHGWPPRKYQNPPLSPVPERLANNVPEKPPRGANKRITQYYIDNNSRILEDIKLIGPDVARERWQFGAKTWYGFCQRNNITLPRGGNHPHLDKHSSNKEPIKGKHNYPENRKPVAKETVKDKQKSDSHHGTYVLFPPFNDKWAPEVQVKWLEIYPQLAKVFNEGP